MRWDKSSPAKTIDSYQIAIQDGQAKVSILLNGTWKEVKPGRFVVTQKDETLPKQLVLDLPKSRTQNAERRIEN